MLTEEQILRYSRNIILKDIGGTGQEKLLNSKVLIVGAGGLGSPSAYYLAAAGVGTIGIVDYDMVDLSNLQRQILHRTQDVGTPKVKSAMEKLKALNPDVNIITYEERLSVDNVLDLIKEYDLVIDGVDNFPARYLLNDACVFSRKPLVEAGILRFEGMIMTIIPGEGPCYRCVFPEPPAEGAVPTCSQAGVLGAVAGVMGTLQAVEAIKVLLNIGRPLKGRILTFNALEGAFKEIKWSRKKDCPVCGENPTIKELIEYELQCDLRGKKNDQD